jgi:hypothetical protein
MAIFELTFNTDPTVIDSEQTYELDGREYVIRQTWNARDESHSLSFYLTDGTPLALGRKVCLGVPILRGEVDDRLPPGMLLAVDSTGKDVEPGIDELGGDRVKVLYYDAAEVVSML